jgi:DNA-binding CsgD family transcriptional regulator
VLLKALDESLQLSRSSVWSDSRGREGAPELLASIGVPGAVADRTAFASMERLAALVARERMVTRLRNIRSQMKYMHTLSDPGITPPQAPGPSSPSSFLAFPCIAADTVFGIICCEEMEPDAGVFARWPDDFFRLLSRMLGETLASIAVTPQNERLSRFRQVVERAKLQWRKETDPFLTALSARERQVALCVAKGLTNAEIAKTLFISPRTVTTHLERIFLKLQLTSRAALTRYVVENGYEEDEFESP